MTLEVGAEAPDFTLKDQNGQPVTLSDFRGRKNVLLVFFPLAFTGICQGELDKVRDNLSAYDNDDTATLAVSVGPSPTHKIWATESGFTFEACTMIESCGSAKVGPSCTSVSLSPSIRNTCSFSGFSGPTFRKRSFENLFIEM